MSKATVRVTNNGSSTGTVDSHLAGRTRMRLKLAAIAYASARHGIDADDELAAAGLQMLCQVATEYYEVVAGGACVGEGDGPSARRGRVRLKLVAIAYMTARHGIDADQGLARTGLQLLCQAAIEYCEAIMGPSTRKKTVDPFLQIGSGA